MALMVIVDVDENDNGLIELANADMVNNVRNDLAGTSYNTVSNGCAAGGCNGYELISDITLSGEWDPIGNDTTPFTAIFDGNDRTISGLIISPASTSTVAGFFGVIGAGTVTSVRIEGDINPSTSITASGGLAGENQGTIRNSSADVDVRPNHAGAFGGGLVGEKQRHHREQLCQRRCAKHHYCHDRWVGRPQRRRYHPKQLRQRCCTSPGIKSYGNERLVGR